MFLTVISRFYIVAGATSDCYAPIESTNPIGYKYDCVQDRGFSLVNSISLEN